MPRSADIADRQMGLLARDLLEYYDDVTALNACSAFVMHALASALANGGGLDERSATGVEFCTQWLNDRTAELEQQLNKILTHAQALAND